VLEHRRELLAGKRRLPRPIHQGVLKHACRKTHGRHPRGDVWVASAFKMTNSNTGCVNFLLTATGAARLEIAMFLMHAQCLSGGMISKKRMRSIFSACSTNDVRRLLSTDQASAL